MQTVLFDLLMGYKGEAVFNPYRDEQPGLDRPGAAAIRCRNLARYLETFAGARWVLVGEAAGYAGCRFSGIPFTCEAQIAGAGALPWTEGLGLERSSVRARPWLERSARAVWAALGDRTDCLLWNAFPWHPYQTPLGEVFDRALTNRPPGRDLAAGLPALECLLAQFPAARPVAVGRAAQRALAMLGIEAPCLRHPSRGGQRAFAAGLERCIMRDA